MSELYKEYHQLLYPVAYNILQDKEESEDVVQDTILSWLNRDASHIENIKGYLVRSIINKCLNRIRDRKKLHQIDIAPELLVDFIPSLIENKDKLSYSLLMMMERLNPLERAVFILKEVFDYTHKEVADMLNVSEVNSRQILVRAKRRLKQEEGRYEVDTDHHLELYERFIEVCTGKDLSRLLEILREDVKLEQTGLTGHSRAETIHDSFPVAEYLLYILSTLGTGVWFRMLYKEGMPFLVIYLWKRPVGEIYLTGEGEKISSIYIHWDSLEELEKGLKCNAVITIYAFS